MLAVTISESKSVVCYSTLNLSCIVNCYKEEKFAGQTDQIGPYHNIASTHMNKKERDELKSAYRKEKDLRICTNILVVYLVCSEGFGVNKLAASIRMRPNCIGMLVRRFMTDGLDSFRNTHTCCQFLSQKTNHTARQALQPVSQKLKMYSTSKFFAHDFAS